MANAERRHVKCIQHHYREHLKRTGSTGADKVDAALAGRIAAAAGPEESSELASAVKEQALRVIPNPNPNPTPYTLHRNPNPNPNPTPYTLHPTPYTLHPTPYTLIR